MDSAQASSAILLAVLLTYSFTPISGSQTLLPVAVVVPFMDTFSRSQCQPRSVLLNLQAELPQFQGFLFKPPCVSLQRCSGCCTDEVLGCFPTETRNITMQVIKINSRLSQMIDLELIQHMHCECRPKKKVKIRRPKGKRGREAIKKANRSLCAPCGKRRTLDPLTCQCHCLWSEEKCQQKGKKLNSKNCR
ncbi:vascular endothelial growth factor B [Pelodytes ibericus]